MGCGGQEARSSPHPMFLDTDSEKEARQSYRGQKNGMGLGSPFFHRVKASIEAKGCDCHPLEPAMNHIVKLADQRDAWRSSVKAIAAYILGWAKLIWATRCRRKKCFICEMFLSENVLN